MKRRIKEVIVAQSAVHRYAAAVDFVVQGSQLLPPIVNSADLCTSHFVVVIEETVSAGAVHSNNMVTWSLLLPPTVNSAELHAHFVTVAGRPRRSARAPSWGDMTGNAAVGAAQHPHSPHFFVDDAATLTSPWATCGAALRSVGPRIPTTSSSSSFDVTECDDLWVSCYASDGGFVLARAQGELASSNRSGGACHRRVL
ncbi:hypothetical protein PR202_ga09947 [Eleusine coracana subsp. coracana]|uniref:Uncharacterized protein n=1 Tax=Eleusine coracana subsp. coracana TaxID=191504 RepID=A0AAV5C565_ELECO|nr:hypothetical protein PR202_ga09947 [Eleusine coracana subsp. coracana]